MTFLVTELAGKRLELLRELVPRAALIGLLVNPNRSGSESETKDTQQAADAVQRLSAPGSAPIAAPASLLARRLLLSSRLVRVPRARGIQS